MADQATVKGGNGTARLTAEAASRGVVGNIAEFGNDFVTLAELQAKLAVIDLKEGAGRALIPTGALVAAVVLLVTSVPVALVGAAELLAEAMNLHHKGWAYLIVALAAMVLSALIGAIAASRLRRSFSSLERSRDELTRNLSWIRTVVLNSGRLTRKTKP